MSSWIRQGREVCALLGSLIRESLMGRQAPATRRLTQAQRSARTRSALLESAARGLSRHGYGDLVLEDVAREAGYTRGALYHQFKDNARAGRFASLHSPDQASQ